MKRFSLCVAAVLLLSACPASAELIVDAGNWNLQPNLAGQEIVVSISGTGGVINATVVEEIIGSSPLPTFIGGDIITDTIFASNNTGSPSYYFDNQYAYLDVAVNSGSVSVAGPATLAKLIVSTEGVTGGDFVLRWTGDATVGVTTTTPVTEVKFNAGSIHVVPEPSTIVLLCSLLAVLPVMGLRRRIGNKA